MCRTPTAVVAALVALAATRASAVPLLDFVLSGDARGLATGGVDPFRNLEIERRTLLRPAELATLEGDEAWTSLARQNILSITGGDAFAGSAARDLRYGGGAWMNVLQRGRLRVGAGVDLGAADGAALVHSRQDGDLLRLDERAETGAIALGVAYGAASVGATFSQLGAPTTLELRARPWRGLTLALRHLRLDAPVTLAAPSGLAPHSVTTPVSASLDSGTSLDELFAELGVGAFTAAAALATSGDGWVEASATYGRFVARGRLERGTTGGSDAASAGGATIGQLDLTSVTERASAAVEAAFGATRARAAVSASRFGTRAGLQGAGRAAARALFHLDADLGLFASDDFSLASTQASAGVEHRLGPVTLLGGLQLARLAASPGGMSYGSRLSMSFDGANRLLFANALVLGVTAGLRATLLGVRITGSVAQLVPLSADAQLSVEQPLVAGGARTFYGSGGGAADGGSAPPPTLGARLGQLGRALDTYGGGQVVSIEMSRAF